MRNRTVDLLLTMETLCRLSYRGSAVQLTRRVFPWEIRGSGVDHHAVVPAGARRSAVGPAVAGEGSGRQASEAQSGVIEQIVKPDLQKVGGEEGEKGISPDQKGKFPPDG